MERLGAMLKKARTKKGLTQKELSEKLGYTTSQFISVLERSKASIPLNRVKDFCRILDLQEINVKRELFKDYRRLVTKEIG